MAGNNFLLRQWHNECKVFADNLLLIRKRPSKKAVHDIRVSVKKLKSHLQLTETLSENPTPVFETIRQFFKITGKYRDTEMSLALLNKTGKEENIKLPSFIRHLKSILAITKAPVIENAALPHEKELETVTRQMDEMLEGVTDEQLTKIIEEQGAVILREVKALMDEFTKNAHEIRIKLKRLFYWLSHCPVNAFFDKRQMKKFEQALNALGRWHDYIILHSKLRYFRKEYQVKGTEEYGHSRKMEEVLMLVKRQWLADAADKIKNLIS